MLKITVLFIFLSTMTNIVFAVKPSKEKINKGQDTYENKEEYEDDSSIKAIEKRKIKGSKNEVINNFQKSFSASLPPIPKGIQNFASDVSNVILTSRQSTSYLPIKSEMTKIQSSNNALNRSSISNFNNKNSDLSVSSLINLPFDITSIIYQYLDLSDQNSLSITCKRLNKLFNLTGLIHLEKRKISKNFLSVLKKKVHFLAISIYLI